MSNVALVIGGTSGIGAAVTKVLRAAGRTIISVDEKKCDVRSATKIVDVIGDIWSDGDFVSEMVYCAGINELEWLGQLDGDNQQYDKVMDIFDINVVGFIRIMDELVRLQGWAYPVNVVAISSDAAVRPLRTSIAYCASKAALDMAVRVAARELGQRDWRVNAVAPGMVRDTGMTAYIDARVPEVRGWSAEDAMAYEISQEVTRGRVDPQEVADLVYATLTGPRHLNGAIIPLNGGR